MTTPWELHDDANTRPLRAYLLATLDWDVLVKLQRRLVYDVSGDANLATLIVCDHPPSITMGRTASRLHVRLSPETLADREWSLHWLTRGGGCWLHTPGQVALYPILPLSAYRLSAADYVATLCDAIGDVVRRFCPDAEREIDRPGWRVRGRRVASIGMAIRSGVSSFGAIVNVNPDLELFDPIACDGDALPMTSLQRESPFRVRLANVRQLLLEAIETRFAISRVSVFHHHPALPETDTRYASTARRRDA